MNIDNKSLCELMGSILSWFETLFAKKKATILMVGLDAAGKTAILLKLKLNEVR